MNDGRMHRREADRRLHLQRLLDAVRDPRARRAEPDARIAALNFSRSSALSIAFLVAPISSTPYFVSTPSRARSSAQLSAVCPPIVGSSASGRSRSMISATIGQVIGSM